MIKQLTLKRQLISGTRRIRLQYAQAAQKPLQGRIEIKGFEASLPLLLLLSLGHVTPRFPRKPFHKRSEPICILFMQIKKRYSIVTKHLVVDYESTNGSTKNDSGRSCITNCISFQLTKRKGCMGIFVASERNLNASWYLPNYTVSFQWHIVR